MQALLEITDEAQNNYANIAEQQAPTGTEYLHGICYWLAIKNHFFIVQHTSINSKSMEEYLTWLFRETKTLSNNQYVELQAVFDIGSIGGDLDNLSSLQVGGIIPPSSKEQRQAGAKKDYVLKETDRTVHTDIDNRYLSFDKAEQVLNTIFGHHEAQEIMKKVPEDVRLDVNVNIGYKTTKKGISKEFMNDLASALRNLPDGEIQMIGKDGKIKGDEARLSLIMPFKPLKENSSLLNLENVKEQLIVVYNRFLEDGKITL